jgi:hypothetical protein
VTMRPPRPSPRTGDGQRLAGIHDNGITPASACSNCHSAIPWIGQARIDLGFKDKLRPPRVGMAPRGEAQVVKEAKRATGAPATEGNAWHHVVPSACAKQRNCITLADRVMPRARCRDLRNQPPHTRRDERGHSVLPPSVTINTSPALTPDREGAATRLDAKRWAVLEIPARSRFQLLSPNRTQRSLRCWPAGED